MHRFLLSLRAALVLLVATLAPAAHAQTTAPVRVVLTCQRAYCDPDFQRTELSFVGFVNDVASADVQALVTSDPNGAGGETYTVRLIGRGRFEGRTDTYTVPLPADATEDVQRRALARTLAAGLMPFVAQAGGLDGVTIAARAGVAAAGDASAAPVRDPWNGWVFSATLAGNFNGDENRQSLNSRLYTSASRVTDALIARVNVNANRNLNRFDLRLGPSSALPERDTTIRNEQTSASLSALVARSVGPRTTVGGTLSLRTSTFDNTDLAVGASVGVEGSLYPFAQSTSRLVTLRYNLGASHVQYADTTVYDRIAETLFTQSARFAVELRQPWGTVGLFTLADHTLNHPDQYSLTQAASVDVRLFKGFSVGFYGGANLTRDQRNIPRQSASRDDVLLQRRALKSGYDYFGGVGLRYTFGSAVASVVNNRFLNGYSLSFSY